MSNFNSVNSVPQNVQLGSEDLPIAAEWVATGEEEHRVGLRRLVPPTAGEITGEELQATDAIAFNFLQIPPNSPSKPSVEEEDPAPPGKLSPALIGGLACLILANGLLLWHQGTRLVNPPPSVTATNPPSNPPPPSLTSTAGTTSPKLSLANLSELPPPAPSPKNLAQPEIASLNSINSVKPTAKPLPAHQAIAALTPPTVPAYQALEALDPSTPQARNALSELLLPPSLQPQMVYSNALPPGSPYPQGTAPTLPAIAVRPPQQKPLPPTPSYSATLQPQGTVSLPTRILPPPPPVSVNSLPLPAAPPVAPATVPALAPAPTGLPSNPSTMTTGQTNGYTTDQMLRQTLNQQNQMEIEAYQQANTPFQQKVKQKLQPLMPQIQSIQQGDTPPPGDTQGLVEQLQRLNQAE